MILLTWKVDCASVQHGKEQEKEKKVDKTFLLILPASTSRTEVCENRNRKWKARSCAKHPNSDLSEGRKVRQVIQSINLKNEREVGKKMLEEKIKKESMQSNTYKEKNVTYFNRFNNNNFKLSHTIFMP